MRWRLCVLGLALGWFGPSSPAWAILIVEHTPGAAPVGGYLVSNDGATLKIKTVSPDGKEQSKVYDISKIDIIHQIDVGRLKKLVQSDPKAYFVYAQELADKQFAADPEAGDTARRLFLIAAHLDPGRFGRDALLGMSALAATGAEARRCRAMAFLLDPAVDAALKPAPAAEIPAGALQDFQKALQDYRTGRIVNARKLAGSKDVDVVFGMAPGRVDKATFLQWCTDAEGAAGAPPPEDHLRRILRAELWVIDRLSRGNGGDKTDAGETKWSSILQAGRVKPVSPLSLETMAEDVDPRQCLYRDGKWAAP